VEFNIDGPSGTLQVALVLLVGLGTFGYGGYGYAVQSAAVGSAQTVDATVVTTTVETVEQRRGTGYAPRATFNYTYDGRRYTSANVYPGPLAREFDSEAAARAQLRGYEPGSTVTAYVPPESPGAAFLRDERSDKPLFVMGAGAVLVVGAVGSFLRG